MAFLERYDEHEQERVRISLEADHDSGLGEEEHDVMSTSSATSSVFQYRLENGRTYHRYGERDYVLPNDEPELDRLEHQHQLLLMTFGPGLTTCGAEANGVVQRVLDVGTGTGSWAMMFADEHPQAIVIGTDISPVQPPFVPPNVWFEVNDVEQPWAFSYKFDLVFSRMMTGAISDWRKFVKQSFDNLNPGGYLEVQDISFHLRSNDGTLPGDAALAKWAVYMLEASIALGAPLDSIESVRDIMSDVGFEDVQQRVEVWPMNSWPKDLHLKRIGVWTFNDFTMSLTGISAALFTRGLGWSMTELEAFLVDVKHDMQRTAIHAFWPMLVHVCSFSDFVWLILRYRYAVHGRKPV